MPVPIHPLPPVEPWEEAYSRPQKAAPTAGRVGLSAAMKAMGEQLRTSGPERAALAQGEQFQRESAREDEIVGPLIQAEAVRYAVAGGMSEADAKKDAADLTFREWDAMKSGIAARTRATGRAGKEPSSFEELWGEAQKETERVTSKKARDENPMLAVQRRMVIFTRASQGRAKIMPKVIDHLRPLKDEAFYEGAEKLLNDLLAQSGYKGKSDYDYAVTALRDILAYRGEKRTVIPAWLGGEYAGEKETFEF